MVLINHHQTQLCKFSIMLYITFIKKLYDVVITMFMHKEILPLLTAATNATASTQFVIPEFLWCINRQKSKREDCCSNLLCIPFWLVL